MTFFKKYLEPIRLSGDSEALLYQAYRLDGTHPAPDLRRDASVGSFNCCDYFFFLLCGNLVLVEDTQLAAYIIGKKQEFNYLKVNDKTTYIPKLICQENALKVYGSLFVLYRFIIRSLELKLAPAIDSIQFWFVVNDADRCDALILERYDYGLKQELSGRFGKTIVNEVVVMTKNDFIGRCEKASKDKAVLGVISVQN